MSRMWSGVSVLRCGATLQFRLALALVLALAGQAAAQNPVTWSASTKAAKVKPGDTFKVDVVAKMEEGWHVYSVEQPPPPIATRISVPGGQPFALAGAIDAPAPRMAFDQSFGINTELYDESAAFTLPVKVAADAPGGKQTLKVQAYYQTCNNQLCLPPKTVPMEVAVEVAAFKSEATVPQVGGDGSQVGGDGPQVGGHRPQIGDWHACSDWYACSDWGACFD